MSSLPQFFLTTLPDPASYASRKCIVVPGRDNSEGLQFLRSVARGSTLGTGSTFARDLEKLRQDYNAEIKIMDSQIQQMRAEGKSASEIAEWAVAERLRIARSIRMRQNPGALISLEIRDNYKYGLGGRNLKNMSEYMRSSSRAAKQGFNLNEALIDGARRPNLAITEGAARAATYLRYGGPILITIGAGVSAYNIASSRPEDRGRVVAEEAGGWTGSWILSGAAVALFVALAPETGGFSLLGIGFLGGAVGGAGGSLLADKIYYSSHPHIVTTAQQAGVIPSSMVQTCMPPPPVCPRCHYK